MIRDADWLRCCAARTLAGAHRGGPGRHPQGRRTEWRHVHRLEPRDAGRRGFTAIINPGEGAILAVAARDPTPVVVGDGIAIRPIMKLTLSADHRVVDGETGARFLGALRRRLEAAEELRALALAG